MIESSKPEVIVIAYYFPPAEEIGGLRPYRFYKYLRRMGFPCHVITASKPSDPCPPGVVWLPDSLASRWSGASAGKHPRTGYLELLLRKFMFPGHLGLAWSIEVARRCRALTQANASKKFILFSTYPPMGVLFAGLLTRRGMGIPWISDFRDPLDVDVKVVRISRWKLFCSHILERFVIHTADHTVVNSHAAADRLIALDPSVRSKLAVIFNGFDPEDLTQALPLPDRSQRIILHPGSLYLGRNPNIIVASLSRLRQRQSPEAMSVCLHLVGASESKARLDLDLMGAAEREGWLKLTPLIPRQEARRLTAEADGLLLLQPQSRVQVPAKLYEYICIGRPILALVPRQSAVELVLAKAGVPYVCVYSDDEPEAADEKLLQFLRLPSAPVAYSDWFRSNFNAESHAADLASIIETVLAKQVEAGN